MITVCFYLDMRAFGIAEVTLLLRAGCAGDKIVGIDRVGIKEVTANVAASVLAGKEGSIEALRVEKVHEESLLAAKFPFFCYRSHCCLVQAGRRRVSSLGAAHM